jgi:phosphoribosylaminoimidazolecarboxamide formyltransferase/IMP cyclohydrolase
MKTALLASYEKDAALLRLGKFLTENGWTLLGSAGTAKHLNAHGIPCRDVAEIVGAPILGHRVVTLSRELHAGLLATAADQAELDKLGVPRIDLVYVTLYPLEKTIADPAATPDDVLEKTDIGGPTLLRAAAKGRRLALSDPSQIALVESFVSDGELEDERERLAVHLAAAAERRVAEYVAASASYWEKHV